MMRGYRPPRRPFGGPERVRRAGPYVAGASATRTNTGSPSSTRHSP